MFFFKDFQILICSKVWDVARERNIYIVNGFCMFFKFSNAKNPNQGGDKNMGLRGAKNPGLGGAKNPGLDISKKCPGHS